MHVPHHAWRCWEAWHAQCFCDLRPRWRHAGCWEGNAAAMLKSGSTEHSLAALRTPGAVFKVGRREGNDLLLDHQVVSRDHAE